MKFRDFFENEDPANEIFEKILDVIFDEEDDDAIYIDRLTEEAKVVYFSWWCDNEIHNGGFDQFFFNSSGDHTIETVSALSEIGASVSITLFEKAIALFPSYPDKDREKRWSQMEHWEDSDEIEEALDALDTKFYEYEDNIAGLVNEYVTKHPEASIMV